MKRYPLDKDAKISIGLTLLMVISYAVQRLLGYYTAPTREGTIILAMVNTALLLLVTLLLLKRENVFYAMLAAMIGYKMLPVELPSLYGFSPDAGTLYFIVKKAALLIFAFVAYRLYKKQTAPKALHGLPLAAILLAVPFFSEIAEALVAYFHLKTGSMLGGFFSKYACYIAASLIILGLSWFAGKESMRFAAYFEYAALGINILKTASKIAVFAMDGAHISKSLYGWLVVYAALMVLFFAANRIKQKQES